MVKLSTYIEDIVNCYIINDNTWKGGVLYYPIIKRVKNIHE